MLIRELAADERPRERCLNNGPACLSDSELISLLLGSGRANTSALDLAREILRDQGLAGLVGAMPPTLRRAGVGPAKTATLLAALEIGARLARAELPEREPLVHPAAVARYLQLRYGRSDQEVMGALFLDVRQRLLSEREIFRGTLQRTAVEPRALLKEALLQNAAGLIVFHNHPSSDPSPSSEDLLFTRRLSDAADQLGIRLVDHVILGSVNRWVSLRERGGW